MKQFVSVVFAAVLLLAFSPGLPPGIQKVESVSVSILAYYKAPADVQGKIVERLKQPPLRAFQDIVFRAPTQDKNENTYIAYIGAGTILRDNYILTVAHLVQADEPELKDTKPILWVIVKGLDHPIRAEVVAETPPVAGVIGSDYAVLKLTEDLGRPGARIASGPATAGQELLFSGTNKGTAFFLRRGWATAIQHFFSRDEKGSLHLSYFSQEPLVAVYPAGPGDSGGGIFNEAGELVGIMYAGVQIAQEMYVFTNGLDTLMGFLREHKLEHLATP